MYEEDILTLIPQKPPYVMVDKLLYSDDDFTRTAFTITANNIFVTDGNFSEAGLIENILQTAAAGAGNMAHIESRPIDVTYIDEVKNLEVFELPQIGDELVTEAKVETRLLNAAIVTGKVWRDEYIVAQCEMKVFIDKIDG